MSFKAPGYSDVLIEPAPGQHFVQLYEADERSLEDNVARYICEGVKRGEKAIIIATPGHRAAFARGLARLGVTVDPRVTLFLDAEQTLSRFMVDGEPDRELFDKTIGAAAAQLQTPGRPARIRAYGEMVGLLWQNGKIATAVQLEELWNTFLQSTGFTLFCGYPIDIFGGEFQMAEVDAILCAHTHLLPTGQIGRLEHSVNQALREVFGSKLEGLRLLMKGNFRPAWAAIPHPEAVILWLRNNLSASATDVLARARRHYREA